MKTGNRLGLRLTSTECQSTRCPSWRCSPKPIVGYYCDNLGIAKTVSGIKSPTEKELTLWMLMFGYKRGWSFGHSLIKEKIKTSFKYTLDGIEGKTYITFDKFLKGSLFMRTWSLK